MINIKKLQEKIDGLPHFIRIWLRGGFILLGWLALFLSDSILFVLAIGHTCTVSILLYTNLDLRTDPEQTWKAYRRSLCLELLMCVILILLFII